jgi:hypothetical protein
MWRSLSGVGRQMNLGRPDCVVRADTPIYNKPRFRRFVRVLAVVAAATAASCHRAPDPGRVQQLLTVLPGASEVTADRNTVAYNLDERYPASATVDALNRNLEGNECAMTKADPFNPEPGLPFNKWIEYLPEGGGVPVLMWTGAWQCKPSDDVVVFAFRTGRPSADAPDSGDLLVCTVAPSMAARFPRKSI